MACWFSIVDEALLLEIEKLVSDNERETIKTVVFLPLVLIPLFKTLETRNPKSKQLHLTAEGKFAELISSQYNKTSLVEIRTLLGILSLLHHAEDLDSEQLNDSVNAVTKPCLADFQKLVSRYITSDTYRHLQEVAAFFLETFLPEQVKQMQSIIVTDNTIDHEMDKITYDLARIALKVVPLIQPAYLSTKVVGFYFSEISSDVKTAIRSPSHN